MFNILCPRIGLNEESFSDGEQTRLNKKGEFIDSLPWKVQKSLASGAAVFKGCVIHLSGKCRWH